MKEERKLSTHEIKNGFPPSERKLLKKKKKKGRKTKAGIITVKYTGDEGSLHQTNISGKHDRISV